MIEKMHLNRIVFHLPKHLLCGQQQEIELRRPLLYDMRVSMKDGQHSVLIPAATRKWHGVRKASRSSPFAFSVVLSLSQSTNELSSVVKPVNKVELAVVRHSEFQWSV